MKIFQKIWIKLLVYFYIYCKTTNSTDEQHLSNMHLFGNYLCIYIIDLLPCEGKNEEDEEETGKRKSKQILVRHMNGFMCLAAHENRIDKRAK